MTSLSEKLSDSSTGRSATVPPVGHPRRRLVHVRELDGVRGIAALVVLFHHVCYTSISPEGWGNSVRLLSAVSHYGAAGVDLFFVLSGFLISSLLIEDRGSPRYYHDFYWKRALRILPLYFVCLAGVLTFYPHSGTYVLASALFIANFAWLFHIDPAGPFWTLAIEEQFYLIWPTVVRRRSIEAISRWAMAIGLGAVALRLLAAYTGHHNYQFTFFRCDGLGDGCVARLPFRALEPPELPVPWGKISVDRQHHPRDRACHAFRQNAWRTQNRGIQRSLSADSNYALCRISDRLPAGASREALRSDFPVKNSYLLRTHQLRLLHDPTWYIMYLYDQFRGPLQAGDVGAYALRFFTVLGVTVAISLLSRYLLELPASSLRRYVLQPAGSGTGAEVQKG